MCSQTTWQSYLISSSINEENHDTLTAWSRPQSSLRLQDVSESRGLELIVIQATIRSWFLMVCHSWSCVIEHLFVMTQSDSDNKEQARWLFLTDTSRSHQVWRGLHRWPPGLAAPPASSPCPPPPRHPSFIHTLCQSCCQPEPTVAIARRRARRCIFFLGQSSSSRKCNNNIDLTAALESHSLLTETKIITFCPNI